MFVIDCTVQLDMIDNFIENTKHKLHQRVVKIIVWLTDHRSIW